MLSNIKSVIFDIGGVLIDLDRDRCVDSFTRIGFPQAAELIDFYHPADFFNKLERGEMSAEEVCDKIRSLAGKEISNEAIAEAYSDFLVEIPLYKLRFIDTLRERGMKIYALSNINPLVMPKVRALFEADGKRMEDYFDYAYLSYEMKSLKPDPEIFEMLLSHSGVNPAESLYIDDSQKNIEAGAPFGFQLYLAEAHEDYTVKMLG